MATLKIYDSIRQFVVAYLRNEQDKDLQAFNLKFDEYYLESSLYTNGYVEETVQRLMGRRQNLRTRRRTVNQVHRLRRRQDRVMRKAMVATPPLCRTWPTTSEIQARLYQGGEHPGHRPPRHHRPRAGSVEKPM